jgi:hypothetical protein
MDTIQAQWEQFEKQVLPANASAIQRRDMEIAFYAGASSMFRTVEVVSQQFPENEAVEILKGVDQEIKNWARIVVKASRH